MAEIISFPGPITPSSSLNQAELLIQSVPKSLNERADLAMLVMDMPQVLTEILRLVLPQADGGSSEDKGIAARSLAAAIARLQEGITDVRKKALAHALPKLSQDADLKESGSLRATTERVTCKTFEAYRESVVGRGLVDEDTILLSWENYKAICLNESMGKTTYINLNSMEFIGV